MKLRRIPIPYARLVHQFILEIRHGLKDMGHESLRRRTYAERVLDRFGEELDNYHGSEAQFRSCVFTPILQRQLRGVPDSYAPSIRHVVARHPVQPTITQATTFYLGNDPLDPRCIPSYRRNLVYIREMLWHLGILMGEVNVKSTNHFNVSLETNDFVMEGLRVTRQPSTRGIPKFNELEVAAIFADKVQAFFTEELSLVVCTDTWPLVRPS